MPAWLVQDLVFLGLSAAALALLLAACFGLVKVVEWAFLKGPLRSKGTYEPLALQPFPPGEGDAPPGI